MPETEKPSELEIKPSAGTRLKVLILIALGALISFLLVLLLSGGGRDFFRKTTTLTTYMPDGTGLAPGSEVRLSGISIGTVTQVDMSGSLDPQRVVRVEMKVNSQFLKNIPRDSEATIGADTLVGFKFVDIQEGQSPLPLTESGEVKSEPVKQATDRADLVIAFQKELDQVDRLLTQISSPDTTVGRFFFGEAEYNRFLSQISSFDAAIHSFVSPKSQVGQALFSDAMYKRIREPLLQLDKSLAAIQQGEGSAGKLFASDDQYNQMVAQVKSFRTGFADPGPFLSDDSQYRKMVKLVQDTNAVLAGMTEGEGRGAKLLNDPQLYQSLNTTLLGMETLLRDFRENPQKYMRYQVFNKKKHAAVPKTP